MAETDTTTGRRPVPTLTDFQRAVLEWYMQNPWVALAGARDPCWLALVATGDRKAAWVTTVGSTIDHSAEDLERWFREVGICYRRTGSAPNAYFQRGTTGYLLARDPDRFELLPAADATTTYRRMMGGFLDYHTEAIDARVEGRAASGTQRQIDVRRKVVTADALAYCTFVPYIPPRSIAGYERAISAGKRTATRLETLVNAWEMLAISAFVEHCYQRHRARYVPAEPSSRVERARWWLQEKTTPDISKQS